MKWNSVFFQRGSTFGAAHKVQICYVLFQPSYHWQIKCFHWTRLFGFFSQFWNLPLRTWKRRLSVLRRICHSVHQHTSVGDSQSDSTANGWDRLKAFLCEMSRVLLIRPESFGFSAYTDYFRLNELMRWLVKGAFKPTPLVQTFRLFSCSAVKPGPDRGPNQTKLTSARPKQEVSVLNLGSVHV